MNPQSSLLQPAGRLMSLDAYRGFVMICLAANGFGIAETARESFPDSPLWASLRYQFDHVPWVGCAFWDLIQPSFMFMVGVALPFSAARRLQEGQSAVRQFLHVLVRSLLLILIGVFLSSTTTARTNFAFMNVLTQIGLGYPFLWLLSRRSRRIQAGTAGAIVLGYWAWFALTPVDPAFNFIRAGLPADWTYLTGFAAHWQKAANPAGTFDVWFLNLFPRETPFISNPGGYQTLNFIPSLATMIFGLLAGELLRTTPGRVTAVRTLVVWGIAFVAAGWLISAVGLCPLVKRIWTPSWTLFSSGWTLLMLASFVAVIDVGGWRAWAYPLVVAGMNSIVLYLMSQLLRKWTAAELQRHFGPSIFGLLGPQYVPLVRANLVLLTFWLVVWWMYRQRLFVRL